jgi:hypothetical protein
MLAARDQENLVYTHQTNAVGKPLNQGVRGLHYKQAAERAPKTPFKASVNDETNPTGLGAQRTGLKTLGKREENCLQTKEDGNFDGNAFVTPMGTRNLLCTSFRWLSDGTGPRTRAPLGNKTTNAKARAFQTPAPLQQTTKPEKKPEKAATVRKSIKSKIRIAPSEPVEADVLSKDPDSDVPDVEYCPPPPIELPDPPEDITYDENLPYLRGNNLCGGYGDVYDVPRDEHGVSLRERKEEEAYGRILQEWEDKFREEIAKPLPTEDEDDAVDAIIAAGPKKGFHQNSNVDTVRAKVAVSELSARPPTKLPLAATKGTASSIQKRKPHWSARGATPTILQPTNATRMRHNAAIAASRTTIGYSKGRDVSSFLPEKSVQGAKVKPGKIDQSKIHPLQFRELYGEPPIGSKMWDRFQEDGLFDDESKDEGNDPGRHVRGMHVYADDDGGDDEAIFQLPIPEET